MNPTPRLRAQHSVATTDFFESPLREQEQNHSTLPWRSLNPWEHHHGEYTISVHLLNASFTVMSKTGGPTVQTRDSKHGRLQIGSMRFSVLMNPVELMLQNSLAHPLLPGRLHIEDQPRGSRLSARR